MTIADPNPIELLPARMVNQYVFCPRYFYLAWVQKHVVDNDNTVEGNLTHRVVDQQSGNPRDSPNTRATSVEAVSPQLGIVARIDAVQTDPDGQTVAVDIKHGAPMPDGSPWPGDALQSIACAVALNDSGVKCSRAAVWYARTRQRCTITIDPTELDRLRRTLADMRAVAEQPAAPPPLIASRRCETCTLASICLPDEINNLTAQSDQPPRRLLPRDPDQRPVHITESGSTVGIRRGRLIIKRQGDQVADVRLIDAASVNLYGNVQISAQATRELLNRNIPITWFSYGGWFLGMATGLPGKNATLRIAQARLPENKCLLVAREIVAGKITNQRTLLRRNARTDVTATLTVLHRLAKQARNAGSTTELLGIEGAAANAYFEHLPTMLREDRERPAFDFSHRNRRPPADPVNALLSFCYSILAREMAVICHRISLDPFIGVYHRPRYGRPAMALDLIEEFRPIIADSATLTLINNGEVGPGSFIHHPGAVQLTTPARKAVISAYERRLEQEITHPVFGYKVTYRRALELQARLFAAFVVGEHDRYTAMTTR